MGYEGYEDLVEFLEQLIERDELEHPVSEGIAKKVVTNGMDSLSEKQKEVIYKTVDKYKNKYKCELCLNSNVSCLMDYINIADFGKCLICEYDENKFKDD